MKNLKDFLINYKVKNSDLTMDWFDNSDEYEILIYVENYPYKPFTDEYVYGDLYTNQITITIDAKTNEITTSKTFNQDDDRSLWKYKIDYDNILNYELMHDNEDVVDRAVSIIIKSFTMISRADLLSHKKETAFREAINTILTFEDGYLLQEAISFKKELNDYLNN